MNIKYVILGILHTTCVFSQSPEIPMDTTYTVHSTYLKLIRDYPDIKPVTPFRVPAVVALENIVYRTIENTSYGKRKLHADIFFPAKEGKYPALILIHGGGWRSGNKSMNTPMAQQLAARGFVVVSVEYRLSLEAKYPAAVHDIKAVVRWMRANARSYSIDENQIAVAGASAGGQLASLIGTTNGDRTFEDATENTGFSSEVQAVIDLDGLLDFTHENNLQVKRTENSADVTWLEGFYEQVPDKWKEASAIHWVSKQSPPFLFINSAQTRFAAGYENMVAKLNAHGIYNEVHQLDAPHSYWLFHPWFDPTVEYMDQFLKKVFK